MVAALPAAAATDDSDVVINEVYARGGSANQPYTTKFIELYNPTDASIDLAGRSVQYRSASGTGAASTTVALERSEERRVGKECRSRRGAWDYRKQRRMGRRWSRRSGSGSVGRTPE